MVFQFFIFIFGTNGIPILVADVDYYCTLLYSMYKFIKVHLQKKKCKFPFLNIGTRLESNIIC